MDDFLSGMISGGLTVLILSISVIVARERNWQNEAVAHGAASYFLNPTNGISAWRWNK